MNTPSLGGVPLFFQAAVRLVLRVVLSLAGLVFMTGLLLLGLVAGSALLIWALVRGRRPGAVRFRRWPGPGWAERSRAAGRPTSPDPRTRRVLDEVIDIEAREVPEPVDRQRGQ